MRKSFRLLCVVLLFLVIVIGVSYADIIVYNVNGELELVGGVDDFGLHGSSFIATWGLWSGPPGSSSNDQGYIYSGYRGKRPWEIRWWENPPATGSYPYTQLTLTGTADGVNDGIYFHDGNSSPNGQLRGNHSDGSNDEVWFFANYYLGETDANYSSEQRLQLKFIGALPLKFIAANPAPGGVDQFSGKKANEDFQNLPLYNEDDVIGVSGQISGRDSANQSATWAYYDVTNGSANVVAPSVPEPATILLLGAGLAGLAGFGRKKIFKK